MFYGFYIIVVDLYFLFEISEVIKLFMFSKAALSVSKKHQWPVFEATAPPLRRTGLESRALIGLEDTPRPGP